MNTGIASGMESMHDLCFSRRVSVYDLEFTFCFYICNRILQNDALISDPPVTHLPPQQFALRTNYPLCLGSLPLPRISLFIVHIATVVCVIYFHPGPVFSSSCVRSGLQSNLDNFNGLEYKKEKENTKSFEVYSIICK